MKTFASLLIGAAFAFAAVAPAHAVTEQEAIATFKADIEKLDAENRLKEAQKGGNPAAGIVLLRQLANQLRAVRTEGLPADLKTAYHDTLATIKKLEQVFAGLPDTAAEFQAYITTKATQDPAFLQKFQTDLMSAMAEMQPKAKVLDEVGRKYGIDNLGKVGKGVGN